MRLLLSMLLVIPIRQACSLTLLSDKGTHTPGILLLLRDIQSSFQRGSLSSSYGEGNLL